MFIKCNTYEIFIDKNQTIKIEGIEIQIQINIPTGLNLNEANDRFDFLSKFLNLNSKLLSGKLKRL